MSEFTEVKTKELSGEALNWAVAIAENLTAFVSPPQYGNPHLVCVMPEHVHRGGYRYSPSTEWAQGGQLIEKHAITLAPWSPKPQLWIAEPSPDLEGSESGPTPLIAACRAIVASVLGETVSVPKELLS
ncbi:DUF2591 domain-containing protein [Pseudomonas syringae]|uniref:DUF2591 domain-containing protein n=1 Tax=Pseudomonas syringae TaxID=317 RepID=UPI003F7507CA